MKRDSQEKIHKPHLFEFALALIIAISLIGLIVSEPYFKIPYSVTIFLIAIFVAIKINHILKHGGTIIEDYFALTVIILFGILHTLLEGKVNAILIGVIILLLFASTGLMLWVKKMFRAESVTHFLTSYAIFVLILILLFGGTYYRNNDQFTFNGQPTYLELKDAIYFSAITFTTVGYGDFSPLGVNRIIAALEALLATIFNIAFIGYILTARKT